MCRAKSFKDVGKRSVPDGWLLPLSMVLLLFSASDLTAQTSTRFTGYWEHQFSVGYGRGAWTQLDYDRFRADLRANASRRASASAGFVWQMYRGNTSINLSDAFPESFNVPDSLTVELQDRRFLNHAYFTLRPGAVEVTVGKQYLTWGAAWAFNPTELFRPKDLLEPTYEREGVGALSVKLPFGPLSNVMIAYLPEGNFDTSPKVLRVRHHVEGFDISAMVAETYEQPAPAAFGSTRLPIERRLTLGGDITGELFGLGVWAEGTWSERAGERWVEATVGGNYTLADGTLLMIEGFYNGRGESADSYSLEQWLGRLHGDGRTLGKGTVYAMASRRFGDLWNVAASAITNTGDGSWAFIPAVTYAFSENVDLVANLIFSVGADGTEYGSGRQGGFVRGRVYF